MFLATVLGYGLFFYHGVAYGARFFYETFPFVAILGGAAVGDAEGALSRRPLLRAALGGALLAMLGVGLWAEWPAVQQHAGRRGRTHDGAQLAALRRPELHDAVVFVDSMVIPAAMTEHPGRIEDNHPLVVKDNGDAADAGYLRLHPGRRPYRLVGLRLVPLKYPADAPVRDEGGALYPLEVAQGGFGDRVSTDQAFRLPLSNREALRFRAREPGARFAFPTWVPPGGASAIHLEVVAHPGAPAIQLAADGETLSGWLPTRADRPRLLPLEVPASLAPGRHTLEVRLREKGTFLMDYVELRPTRGAP